jgi:hypothetical protein
LASRATIFQTREGATYLALTVPTLVIQAFYSVTIFGAVGLGIPPPFNIVTQLYGAVTLILSLIAIATFRPTIAMLTLGASYFLITLLPQTTSAEPLLLLVPVFLLMISFNYGRAAETAAGHHPIVSIRGPSYLKALSIFVGGLLPILAAVMLVMMASFTVDVAQAEVGGLPYPLSDLLRLYLQTRIGFVLLATAAAGILLWVIREFFEPVILYYSLEGAAAKQMVNEEFGEIKKVLEKRFLKWRIGSPLEVHRPSIRWIAAGFVLVAVLLVLFGPTPMQMAERGGRAAGLLPVGLDEKALIQMSSDAADYIDSNLLRVENLIRYLISLLWGD